MANTLITPSIVAREALATLYGNTVMLPLVHTDFSNEFAAVGDTVTVRKPATFTANEFSGNISVQNVTESSVAVKMDKHLDVSVEVTSKQLTLDIQDFNEQVTKPALEALAQKVDSLLLGLYTDIYNTTGTPGTTPTTIGSITAVRKILNDNDVPLSDRYLIIDSAAEDKYLQISGFTDASAVGDDGTALAEARLARKFGLDVIMSQNVPTHSIGTVNDLTVSSKGAVAAGATSVTFDEVTLTGTILKGTTFTVAGSSQVYTVTADATAAANEIAITFSPASLGWADNTIATLNQGVASGHTPNLGFHKSAFAFVTRPLELPMGGADAAIENYKGVGIRVVMDYNSTTKTNVVSFDMLCGVKTLDPKRAVRLFG